MKNTGGIRNGASLILRAAWIVVLAVVINSCKKEEPLISYDIAGDWTIISFVDYVNDTVITKTAENTWPDFNNGDITVSFIPETSERGSISGITVTNSFAGDYEISNNGGIKISNVISTLIGEPEWCDKFHYIMDAETYQVRDGKYLVIFCDQNKISIKLKRNSQARLKLQKY
jgi:hypothetical protein